MTTLINKKQGIAPILPLIIFIIVLAAVLLSLGRIGQSTAVKQRESAEAALERTVIQCYAIEGRYPPDLAYLSENYGLILDDKNFVYHYESLGDNILPQVSVFSLK